MPLKTNVGVSRKVADNNYGSRGASVNLEVELDSRLIDEPDRLQERIRQAFRLAQQAVDDELSRRANANEHDTGHTAATNENDNEHHNGNGNDRPTPRRSPTRPATARQRPSHQKHRSCPPTTLLPRNFQFTPLRHREPCTDVGVRPRDIAGNR